MDDIIEKEETDEREKVRREVCTCVIKNNEIRIKICTFGGLHIFAC